MLLLFKYQGFVVIVRSRLIRLSLPLISLCHALFFDPASNLLPTIGRRLLPTLFLLYESIFIYRPF